MMARPPSEELKNCLTFRYLKSICTTCFVANKIMSMSILFCRHSLRKYQLLVSIFKRTKVGNT